LFFRAATSLQVSEPNSPFHRITTEQQDSLQLRQRCERDRGQHQGDAGG
jgi:hypothetical protein